MSSREAGPKVDTITQPEWATSQRRRAFQDKAFPFLTSLFIAKAILAHRTRTIVLLCRFFLSGINENLMLD